MTAMNKYKIALVDDDPIVLTMVQLVLENRTDIEVFKFETGEALLKNMETLQPHLLIVDYYLDSQKADAITGEEVIKKLFDLGYDIPTIVLSSQKDMDVAISLLKYHVVDYVEKIDGFVDHIEKSVDEVLSMITLEDKLVGVNDNIKKDKYHLVGLFLAFLAGLLIAWVSVKGF